MKKIERATDQSDKKKNPLGSGQSSRFDCSVLLLPASRDGRWGRSSLYILYTAAAAPTPYRSQSYAVCRKELLLVQEQLENFTARRLGRRSMNGRAHSRGDGALLSLSLSLFAGCDKPFRAISSGIGPLLSLRSCPSLSLFFERNDWAIQSRLRRTLLDEVP